MIIWVALEKRWPKSNENKWIIVGNRGLESIPQSGWFFTSSGRTKSFNFWFRSSLLFDKRSKTRQYKVIYTKVRLTTFIILEKTMPTQIHRLMNHCLVYKTQSRVFHREYSIKHFQVWQSSLFIKLLFRAIKPLSLLLKLFVKRFGLTGEVIINEMFLWKTQTNSNVVRWVCQENTFTDDDLRSEAESFDECVKRIAFLYLRYVEITLHYSTEKNFRKGVAR